MSKFCPCGSMRAYTDCCGPYLAGQKSAPTPEALMRSRYTAFKRGNRDYIAKTQLDTIEMASGKNASIHWLKLEVLHTALAPDGKAGVVEYKAHYQYRGEKHVLHEISQFRLEGACWLYVAGEVMHQCCPGH